MARFAQKNTTDFEAQGLDSYEHGYSFPTDKYTHITKPGLRPGVVDEISALKGEPEWMLKLRKIAYEQFIAKQMPPWGADLSAIDFDKISYYLRPTDAVAKSWDDVPADVKETFERLGIPEAERSVLAGVKAQYDSEVVYGSLKEVFAKDGVIFLSMDDALRQHPDLVKEYFGKVIPSGDNKFSALNTAVWSGGSFVYVPPGVDVKMPLQTYFRINSPNAGQFERTLIIIDEGASAHYIEGCFVGGTTIITENGVQPIETIAVGDQVLTHAGTYKNVYHTQVRPYTGDLYTVDVTGNPSEPIVATSEHPFLIVRRKYKNERNKVWASEWVPVHTVEKGDYVCTPINRQIVEQASVPYSIKQYDNKSKKFFDIIVDLPSTTDFFRLVGYYLAEGSISGGHYLNFSFGSHERNLIDDVKSLLLSVFNETHFSEFDNKTNHGTSVVVNSTRLCRVFEQFGTSSSTKKIPSWMMLETPAKLQQLLLGWYEGDGNFYRKQLQHGFKEIFRISTTSKILTSQARMLLARLDIASGVNVRNRVHEGRLTMYTIVVGGEYAIRFGKIVGVEVEESRNNKKRATAYHIDEKYLYSPIRAITKKPVLNEPVYNFSVETEESYVAGGVAVHNCTAPNFSTGSLHSAVVEIFVKKGARCQYTTVQNWYKNVYNLVTKRAWVEEEGQMVWTDFNMGSKVTMKYPGFILAGKGAKGETLSMALAGAGQHQDTGSKAIHLAPYTSSTIVSKSISKSGGRTSYRGLVNVGPKAHHSKNTVICDALLLDPESRSDTYPVDKIFNSNVEIQHEATVSKIGDDQLFYLMSRGVSEADARKLIVNGFIDDLVRQLPLEYAVEMNRLIDHEMEGSIG